MSSGGRIVLSVLPVMVLAGCGDGGSTAKRVDASGGGDVGGATAITPISPATIASLEGTYALESFTVNPTACDVEGPAETSSHDMTFVIAGGPAPEPRYLGLAACSDALECARQGRRDSGGRSHLGGLRASPRRRAWIEPAPQWRYLPRPLRGRDVHRPLVVRERAHTLRRHRAGRNAHHPARGRTLLDQDLHVGLARADGKRSPRSRLLRA